MYSTIFSKIFRIEISKTSYSNIVIGDATHRAANVSSFATLLHHH
jgi:hypothetical protein